MMARFKILHEGVSLKGLKSVIRYNSKDKKGLNSPTNPRLISVISNCGFCSDVNDKSNYKQLVDNFTLSVEANQQLATNSRQKYLYEHAVISFSKEDDATRTIEELQNLALETCKLYDENFENIPYMLFPQRDTQKIHFHILRGFHDDEGKYHRKVQSGRKMEAAAQKIEKKHKLTLTGRNNPDNYIFKNGKRVYFPKYQQDNKKTVKNKSLDIDVKNIKNTKLQRYLFKKYSLNKKNFNTLTKNKNEIINSKRAKIVSLNKHITSIENEVVGVISKVFTNAIEFNKQEIERLTIEKIKLGAVTTKTVTKLNIKRKSLHHDSKTLSNKINGVSKIIKKNINEKNNFKTQKDIESHFKEAINNAYINANTAKDFIKVINDIGIEISLVKRANGNGGITFTSDLISMAAGKVNPYLTYGKIKKNDPELFSIINDESDYLSFHSDRTKQNINDLSIASLNKNYKQVISDSGETLIYYNQKNNDKYPHNYNLKINQDKSKISLGQRSNSHDLKLAYALAKESGWVNAKSDSKELIQRSMVIAYQDNPEYLFFFSTNEPTLKLSALKNIIGNDLLSPDNLIKLYDDNLIVDGDKKELKVFILQQLKKKGEDITIINKILNDNQSLKSALSPENSIRKAILFKRKEKEMILKKETIKLDKISHTATKSSRSTDNRPRLTPYD
jgi:hypothetical protein